MMHILPASWNVDAALVDENEKNEIQEKSIGYGDLISKL